MKKNLKWKKFGSTNVAIVLFSNILVIILVCIFFAWILSLNENSTRYTHFDLRVVILCVIFASIVNGYINYRFIYVPLSNMENMIKHYNSLLNISDFHADQQYLSDISIESVFEFLIKQQQLENNKENEREKQRQKAEIYALQSQINPHFLYNALDSIRGYALLNDMNEIAEIIEALSRVFRNMVSNKMELLPLRQEYDNINNYMKIQQFRFNNKFKYECEIEDELLDKYRVPRMSLQPLVENSIMHGLERNVGNGWVKIKAYTTERRLVLEVIDNGAGISEERLDIINRAMQLEPSEYCFSDDSGHSGIALVNINRRIKLNFGNSYGIILKSTPNIRTTTLIELPLIINHN